MTMTDTVVTEIAASQASEFQPHASEPRASQFPTSQAATSQAAAAVDPVGERARPQSVAAPSMPAHLIGRSPDAPATLAPLPCGVVIFDHPDEPREGTAYLPNNQPQRIRSKNDIRNDALWVSNMGSLEEHELTHPNLRGGDYFSASLAEIAHDLGIDCSRDGQMQCDDAIKIASFMTRAMTIAARAYGWDVSDMGPLYVQEPYLRQDIVKMLPKAPAPAASARDHLVRALTQSHQQDSVPDWPHTTFEPESVFVTLRYNRLNYANALLNCPVPKGQAWTYEKDVKDSPETLEYCMQHPSLVKASVEFDNVSSEHAALVAFGQAGARRNLMRQWISQPELVWLRRFARITITSAWVDHSGYTKVAAAARLPELFTVHPEACLSYSAGLIAANHLEAIASCQWSKKYKIDESNVWATWIRAYDRANMFALALKAHEAGFHVERYGSGSLKLRVSPEQLDQLARFKAEHGFMYPDLTRLAKKS